MALRRVTGQEDGFPEAENTVEDENENVVSIFLNAAVSYIPSLNASGRFSIWLVHKNNAITLE